MIPIDKRITNFIQKHHVLTLATSNDNKPYCCTCFYAYVQDKNCFVITSDENTKHINDIVKNRNIAGAIALETQIIGKIRGIQFTGKIFEVPEKDLKFYRKFYLIKFPFAILMNTHLWCIELDYIKMTDNRLGFGKKITWQNNT